MKASRHNFRNSFHMSGGSFLTISMAFGRFAVTLYEYAWWASGKYPTIDFAS
jgi:hypothetical protein